MSQSTTTRQSVEVLPTTKIGSIGSVVFFALAEDVPLEDGLCIGLPTPPGKLVTEDYPKEFTKGPENSLFNWGVVFRLIMWVIYVLIIIVNS